jgi:hypothetical protein
MQMTHEDLLDIIDFDEGKEDYEKLVNALRAVVELHRPEAQEHGQYEKCWNCNLLYPCPTIQAIEKELA